MYVKKSQDDSEENCMDYFRWIILTSDFGILNLNKPAMHVQIEGSERCSYTHNTIMTNLSLPLIDKNQPKNTFYSYFINLIAQYFGFRVHKIVI